MLFLFPSTEPLPRRLQIIELPECVGTLNGSVASVDPVFCNQ